MVSADVCFGGKGRLHFIPDKTKVNAKLYVETLLPELVQDCRFVLLSGFTFQQDGSHARQSWLKTGLLPTAVNSLGKMKGLRTRLTSTLWTTMSGEICLNATSHFNRSRIENIDELKKVLQLICDQLPQDSINKAILSFPKRLRACVKAGGGHIEHTPK